MPIAIIAHLTGPTQSEEYLRDYRVQYAVRALQREGYQAEAHPSKPGYVLVQDPVRVSGRIEYQPVALDADGDSVAVWRFMNARS